MDQMFDKQRIFQFIDECLAWLRADSPTCDYHWDSPVLEQGDANQTSFKYSNRPDFTNILARPSDQIPPFVAFKADLQYADLWTRFAAANQRMTPADPETLSRYILGAYLSSCKSLQLERELAEIISSNFFDCLQHAKVSLKTFAPLRGFVSDLERIECGDGCHIRKLNFQEYAEIADRYSRKASGDLLDWLTPGEFFLLEKIETFKVTEPGSVRRTDMPEFATIVTALRLVTSGRVAIREIYREPARLGDIPDFFPSTSWGPSRPLTHAGSYTFPAEGQDRLSRFLIALRSSALQSQVRIAVERMDFAAERLRIDDQFIDHIIALEAIYGDQQGGITYKIALRAAAFLKKSPQERWDAFNFIKKAIGLRSAIVHGSGSAFSHDDAERLEALTRDSIEKVILELANQHLEGEPFDRLLLA